jgi:hypothetical protein
MTFLQVNFIFSFEFKYTAQGTDMMVFFQDEMNEYMNILYNGQDIPFYLSVYDNLLQTFDYSGSFADSKLLSSVSTVTTGSFIRLNNYFLIPGNASLAYLVNNKVHDLNLLLDSGLLFQSRIGIIGLFAGYNYIYYKNDGEWSEGYTDSAWNWHPSERYNNEEYSDNKVKFSLVPIINTREFPIIGYAMKTLEGYINVDQDNEKNYSIKLVSQPIKIGPLVINSIEPYYSRKRFDLHAQNNVYGLLTNIDITNRFVFFLDVGYRDYFDISYRSSLSVFLNDDITYTSSLYDDTLYLRFGFPTNYDWKRKNRWHGLSFYMDKEFPVPKIGYIMQINNSRLLMEFGFYKSVNILLSYRFMAGDK